MNACPPPTLTTSHITVHLADAHSGNGKGCHGAGVVANQLHLSAPEFDADAWNSLEAISLVEATVKQRVEPERASAVESFYTQYRAFFLQQLVSAAPIEIFGVSAQGNADCRVRGGRTSRLLDRTEDGWLSFGGVNTAYDQVFVCQYSGFASNGACAEEAGVERLVLPFTLTVVYSTGRC